MKTLVEQDVVRVSADGPWTVDLSRLRDLAVPPTLAGVLQARLDSLPSDERTALQLASVVGRTFWDDAVASLLASDGQPHGDVGPALDRVCGRELVWRSERSSFSGCLEFRFKHALLRDAAYETVLLRERGVLHAAAATWMERRAGGRIDEHLAPIAEHLVLAGEHRRAATMFERAAANAAATGAVAVAIGLYRHAVECLLAIGEDRSLTATRVRVELGHLLDLDDDLAAASEVLAQAESDALSLDDEPLRALALCRLAKVTLAAGDVAAAGEHLAVVMPTAEAVRGRVLAEAMLLQAVLLEATQGLAAALVPSGRALEASREIGDAELEARLHDIVSMYLSRLGRFDEAAAHLDEAAGLARRIGNPLREAMALMSQGVLARHPSNPGRRRSGFRDRALPRVPHDLPRAQLQLRHRHHAREPGAGRDRSGTGPGRDRPRPRIAPVGMASRSRAEGRLRCRGAGPGEDRRGRSSGRLRA